MKSECSRRHTDKLHWEAFSIKYEIEMVALFLGAALLLASWLVIDAIQHHRRERSSTHLQTSSIERQTTGRQETKFILKSNASGSPDLSLKSPAIIYSTTKTVWTGMSTLLGCLLIGEHPFWTSFAPIAIIRLDEVVTATRDVDCIMSTVIGALLGWLIFSVIDNTEILYISVIILVFLCFSSIKVNYAVSIFFITVFIIVITSLGQGIAESWSIERVVGTTTGVAISFVVVFIQSRLIKTDKNTQGRLANLSAVKT